jgi:hypothetical protein
MWADISSENALDGASSHLIVRLPETSWDDGRTVSYAGQMRCQTCHLTFTASRSHARYCSNACRQKAHRQRRQRKSAKQAQRRERETLLRTRRSEAEAAARAEVLRNGFAPELHVAAVRTWRPTGVSAIITDPPYNDIGLYRALAEFAVDVLPDGGALIASIRGGSRLSLSDPSRRPHLPSPAIQPISERERSFRGNAFSSFPRERNQACSRVVWRGRTVCELATILFLPSPIPLGTRGSQRCACPLRGIR